MKKNDRGRPTLAEQNIERVLIRISLNLYQGEDDDLINWFESIPNGKRASYVKTALRAGGMTIVDDHDSSSEFISDDLLDELLNAF